MASTQTSLTQDKKEGYFRDCKAALEILGGMQTLDSIREHTNKLDKIYRDAPGYLAKEHHEKLNPSALGLVNASGAFIPAAREKLQVMSAGSLLECYRLCGEFCRLSATLAGDLWQACITGLSTFKGDFKQLDSSLSEALGVLQNEQTHVNSMEKALRKILDDFGFLEKTPGPVMKKLPSRVANAIICGFQNKASQALEIFRPNNLRSSFHHYLSDLRQATIHLNVMKTWLNDTRNSLREADRYHCNAAQTFSCHLTTTSISMQTKLKDVHHGWDKAEKHFLALASRPAPHSKVSWTVPTPAEALESNVEDKTSEPGNNDAPRSSRQLVLIDPQSAFVNCTSYLMQILETLPYLRDATAVLSRFWELYRANCDARLSVQRVIHEVSLLAEQVQEEMLRYGNSIDSRSLVSVQSLAVRLEELLNFCLQNAGTDSDELTFCATSCSRALSNNLQTFTVFQLVALGSEIRKSFSALQEETARMRDNTNDAFEAFFKRMENNLRNSFLSVGSSVQESRLCIDEIDAKVEKLATALSNLDIKVDKQNVKIDNLDIKADKQNVEIANLNIKYDKQSAEIHNIAENLVKVVNYIEQANSHQAERSDILQVIKSQQENLHQPVDAAGSNKILDGGDVSTSQSGDVRGDATVPQGGDQVNSIKSVADPSSVDHWLSYLKEKLNAFPSDHWEIVQWGAATSPVGGYLTYHPGVGYSGQPSMMAHRNGVRIFILPN